MNKLLLNIAFLFTVICTSCNKDIDLSNSIDDTFYVRNGDSDMPVFMRGNGSSKTIILLLHGGPGDSSLNYMNDNFALQLREEYMMAFWDQRQQGNSHGHLNKEEVTLELMVEDLHQIVKTLKHRYGSEYKIYLMGHSWGGTLGTAYLQTDEYQNEIEGFIEIAGGYDLPLINLEVIKIINEIGAEEIAKGNNVSRWTEFMATANAIDTSNISTDQGLELNRISSKIKNENLLSEFYLIESNKKYDGKLSDPNRPIAVTSNALSIFDQRTLIDLLFSISLSSNLDKIEIPCLLIWGKYDFKVPPSLGFKAFNEIGSLNKTLYIYEHAGHNPMNYDSDRFVMDVKEFIN